MSNHILQYAYTNFYKIKQDNMQKFDPNDDTNQIIGFFDLSNHIWYNAWSLYNEFDSKLYIKTVELLKYTIRLEKDNKTLSPFEKIILKYILNNSKIYIYEKTTQLNLILAVIMYLIKPSSWSKYKIGDIYVYVVKM